MASIESKICDAIEIIVDKAVAEATYDKTVQATILSCVDESQGCYRVQYQDSVFQAYSCDADATYVKGVAVYVLIPGNDLSNRKTILGTVNALGLNYVATAEEDASYEVNGNNIISSDNTFTLCSYAGTQAKVLYSKEYNSSQNLIYVDETAMQEYLSSSSSIICGGTFRTELPTEQQFRGNYGILFALDFLDNTENKTVTRYYTVDVDAMVGNPYQQLYDTRQYGIFDIDNNNFQQVNNISIFCYDFPNSKPIEECVDDIFISGIELCGAIRIDEESLNGYSLTFQTLKGTYFTADGPDDLTIEAQLRLQGKLIDNKNIEYYWFSEHVGVTTQSQYYCKYGGQGWKCLNEYNVLQPAEDDQEPVVEWIPASEILTVTQDDVVAAEVQYKCAAVYNGTVITHTITIKNLNSNYALTIESEGGTQFYYDIGNPTLKCYVNGVEDVTTYTYSWAVTNNVGAFSSLSETTDLNNDYQEVLDEYNQLVADIADETKQAAANADLLQALERTLKDYETVMRVDKNTIYHVDISSITSFSTYQCTVYRNETYIGTTSITLLNTYETQGVYSLIINHGTKAYKYDEDGVSPASSAADSPIAIEALTFTVYDNLGQAIDDDVIQHCDINWIVPTSSTLLTVPSTYTPSSTDSDAETATYSGMLSFSYGIADRYDITKNRNDIYLTVDYKGLALAAKTELTFVKEGEPGTNGTEFVARIVPNVQSGATTPAYWIITEDSNGNVTHNFTPAASNRYLKVQFFHNEDLIVDSVVSADGEGKTATIAWSILRNKYTSSVSDSTSLSVNSSTGVFSYSGYNTSQPAHIVKATVTYDGVIYYATYPVITVQMKNDNYSLTPVDGAGFKFATYTSDGRNPKYDNVNPFEVTTSQLINGYWEDVSRQTFSYAVTYNWSYLGRVYENSSWVSSINLMHRSGKTEENNQLWVKPYDSYDGQCVTNALECVVQHNSTEIGRIHIPVHLMLNRYGLAALNDWDGNSISIDNDAGFILAPQIGAGEKNSDNSFTGVVMGVVKESNSSTKDIGLIGYAEGARSIFLDASTGKSEFGANGKGQIVIDPTENDARIYSGNYKEGSSGLLIDLTKPEIKFGSGNFEVNSSGELTAKGGGKIAGWTISNTALSANNITISSDGTIEGGTSSKGWYIKGDGTASFNSVTITGGSITIGDNFEVNEDGNLTAKNGNFSGTINSSSGTIGGWTISSSSLSNGSITISSSSGGKISASNWSISGDGTAEFGNITITGGTIKLGSLTLSENSFSTDTSSINIDNQNIGSYVQSTVTAWGGSGTAWMDIDVMNSISYGHGSRNLTYVRSITLNSDNTVSNVETARQTIATSLSYTINMYKLHILGTASNSYTSDTVDFEA